LGLDGLVCDLDGVLYRGPEPIPGAAEAVGRMVAGGLRVIYATNNAMRTEDECRSRLGGLGLEPGPGEVLTSAVVTAEEMARRGWAGRTVFLVGSEGIKLALEEAGMALVDGEAARRAEIVVVSGDFNYTYDSVRTAAFAVRAGADFIATNDDPTFPAPDGLWPGAGALVASIATASGRRPEVMGKPHLPMMEAAQRRLEGCRRIAALGDQDSTDLAGGRLMGWMTVLVLSGVTDAAGAAALTPPPDLVLPGLSQLEELLERPES
jgi:HAD superfamily hydrolase (TIGR01450 family)